MLDSVLQHGKHVGNRFGKATASIFVTYLNEGLIKSVQQIIGRHQTSISTLEFRPEEVKVVADHYMGLQIQGSFRTELGQILCDS